MCILMIVSAESLITRLFQLAQLEDAPPILMHQAFKYLYIVSKVMTGGQVIKAVQSWKSFHSCFHSLLLGARAEGDRSLVLS